MRPLGLIALGVLIAVMLAMRTAPAGGAAIAAARPSTWAPGCNGTPRAWSQHPSQIGLTCDSIDVIVGVRWRHWGDATAQASGTLNAAAGCVPNCAEAPRYHYAVTIVAANIGYCATRRVYGTITVRYTQAGRKRTIRQPTYCTIDDQRPSNRPVTAAPSSPPEFYARPAGGFITCGIGGGDAAEQLVHCQGGRVEADPLENVAALQTDGQLETCSRHQNEDRCFEGNVGERTPTLSPGDTDTRGPFTCKVLQVGVECTVTATGKGFLITSESLTAVGG
jgi:hypothetical protein